MTYTVYFFCTRNDAEDADLADYSLKAFYNEKENIIDFENYRFISFRVLDKDLFRYIKRATLAIIGKKYNKIKIYDASGELVRCYR